MLSEDTEVLNFGIGGYGTDQTLLRVENEILGFNPDLLVVAFFINDLIELNKNVSFLGTKKPRFVIDEGELKLVGVPVPRNPAWDKKRGLLALELSKLVRKAMRRTPELPPDLPSARHFSPRSAHIKLLRKKPRRVRRLNRLLRLNAALYNRMCVLAKQHGTKLAVVEVPFKEYYMPSETLLRAFGLQRNQVDFARTQRHLTKLARDCGFLYVNPYAAFARDEPLANYYERDMHLTPRGHERLAQVIASALRSNGYVPPMTGR